MEGTQMEYKKTLMSFSLREILVLLIPVVILLLFLAPRYLESINTSKENLLRHELIVMRSAIDQYLVDKNKYPDTLESLVEENYLRLVPIDPITSRNDTWVISKPTSSDYDGSIADVNSGSNLISSEGTPYAEW